MSRWFRHYAGMMRDDKLVRVAIRSKQSIERVLWIWGAILESAAEIDDNGRYDFDAAEAAYFLRADEADVCAVVDALTDAGRLADGAVVKWSNRQFSSDRSKDRVAAHRERKRAEIRGVDVTETRHNVDVTLQQRHRNSPETETELETDNSTAIAVVDLPIDDDERLKPEHVVEHWNELASKIGKPAVRNLTPERRQTVRARIAQYSIDDFVTVFGNVQASAFLRDAKACGFDWTMKKANFQKVLEGNYNG